MDQLYKQTIYRITQEIEAAEPFVRRPKESLWSRPEFVAFAKGLGVSKEYLRHVFPIYGSQRVATLLTEYYGKDASPIKELKRVPVTSFIRYLLFEKDYSEDQTTQILVDKLGYEYTNARPLIRRVMRKEQASRDLWARERTYPNVLNQMQAALEQAHV